MTRVIAASASILLAVVLAVLGALYIRHSPAGAVHTARLLGTAFHHLTTRWLGAPHAK
jgi:hypothetical protein